MLHELRHWILADKYRHTPKHMSYQGPCIRIIGHPPWAYHNWFSWYIGLALAALHDDANTNIAVTMVAYRTHARCRLLPVRIIIVTYAFAVHTGAVYFVMVLLRGRIVSLFRNNNMLVYSD